ncbi:protein of unknown function [Cupriavidus taiwanensis]|nr:protein of unknown function [Cupriavidus taiwanensis]
MSSQKQVATDPDSNSHGNAPH